MSTKKKKKAATRRKTAAGYGKMHKCEDVSPARQERESDEPQARAAMKPDIDERERDATPRRKAAGPRPRRGRSARPSSAPSTTPDVLPDAIAKPGRRKKKS